MAKGTQQTLGKGLELSLNASVPYITTNIYQQIENNKLDIPTSILWLSGSPGIGKSELLEQVCEKNGFGLIVKYLGTMLIEQITGLPKGLTQASNSEAVEALFTKIVGNDNKVDAEDKKMLKHLFDDQSEESATKWTIPELFSMKNFRVDPRDDDSPIVLLLDDAHLCNKSIQSYLFQLLTLRSIHDHILPKNVAILLAGNRADDKAGYQQIMAPISNRLFFVNVTCSVDDWVMNYAVSNDIRVDIISFLQESESCFQSTPLESAAWASPRSWTYASRALDQYERIQNTNVARGSSIEALQVFMSGHIGTEYSGKYIEYVRLFMQWEADKILTGRKKLPDVTKLARVEGYCLMSAMTGGLLKNLRKVDFKLGKDEDEQIEVYKKMLDGLMISSKEIIPLGLKLLIVGESARTQHVVVARKVLTNEYLINAVNDIVE